MDLFKELAAARSSNGLSQTDLAEKLGVTRLAVARMEVGIGSTVRLLAAMNELEIRLSGVAGGATLPDQVRARRERRGWSVIEAADRAGLAAKTVEAIEAGQASAASLVKLLSVIAPRACIAKPVRSSWGYDAMLPAARDRRGKLDCCQSVSA